jgi:hypothetical protein
MRTRAAALILTSAFSLAATTTCEDGPEPRKTRNFCRYLPTVVGNKWEYKVTVDSKYNPREEYKLTFEITKANSGYEGFPFAYVVAVTKEGGLPEQLNVAPEDDKCYVERVGWAYLLEDDVKVGEWSQSGLIVDTPLEYRRDVEIEVPAKPPQSEKFKCKELFFDNGKEFKPETWRELYADGVGLVYYENNFKQYRIDPFELVDWRLVTYELFYYDVQKDKWKTAF